MFKVKYFCDHCGKEIGLASDDRLRVVIDSFKKPWVKVDACRDCSKEIEKAVGDLLEQTAGKDQGADNDKGGPTVKLSINIEKVKDGLRKGLPLEAALEGNVITS